MVLPVIKKITNLLFFLLIWGYFATVGKYVLVYQESHSLFLFDSKYFLNYLKLPGGIVEYLSAFFIQFCYYPIAGAFFIAGILWLIIFFTQKIFIFLPKYLFFITFLPAIILTFFFAKPDFGMSLPIAFLLNLICIYFYSRFSKKTYRYSFALLTLFLLYLVSAGVFHLFCISVFIFEILFFTSNYKKIFLPVFFTLALLVPAFCGYYIFFIHFTDSYFRLLGNSISKMPVLFYVLLGFYFIVPIVFYSCRNIKFEISKGYKKGIAISGLLILLLTALLLVNSTYDKRVSQMIHLAASARKQNWNEVLKISSEYSGSNYLVSYYTNLALYNSGEMDSHLLEFNQSLGTKGLFFTWDRSRKKSEHGGMLYFDLGFVNEAHHWAFESLISNGENADQLKMLALTNLINDKAKSAAKYLRKLEHSLFYSDWATNYLRFTHDSMLWDNDEFIQHKRAQMPGDDFFMNLNNLAPDLVQMLKTNPANKAALQYLLSYYLLSNQVNLFAETLKEFEYNINELSPLYQQALLIFLSGHPDESEAYTNFKIDTTTKTLFSSYAGALRLQKPTRGNIPNKFEAEFGKTYWYYLHFVSPHGNKVITK